MDLLCRPVRLDHPIGAGKLHATEALVLTGGGITTNSGVTMARLGLKVGVLSYVGDDAWAPVIRQLLRSEGVDDSLLLIHPEAPTSTTVVPIDASGERSFFHCVGAPGLIDGSSILDRLKLLAQARIFLLGYYSLMPNLEPQLPEVFKTLRAAGCQTAMDAAGDGGTMDPLEKILPHLDVWVPSLNEAQHQTGHDDPHKIIATYRACGAPGVLGVKLGKDGVVLSPREGDWVEVGAMAPPGNVIDTTGAGDSFLAGLLTGLIKGLSVEDAGRLGCAAGACCVTSVGGSTGGRDFTFTASLAGLRG